MAVSKEEILDAIGNMSLIDVTDLVKMMEDKFGVSAAAPVAVAAAGGAAAAAPVEEKTEFTVVLKAAGEKKVEVIKAVRDLRPDHAVLLSGTPKERRFNADIMASAAATDVHNVADDLPIRTLLPLLERAHSMISVDTGPAHAAAALGCPTVSLFGTANATLFRPGGATTVAVALTGAVNGVQNIMGITAESVIAAWFDLIRSAETPAAHSVMSLTCD